MTESKVFASQIKSLDEGRGMVTALVAVFGNIDVQNDRVMPGAFTQTIAAWKAKAAQGQFLPVVYGHRDDPDFIIGKVVDMRQTAEGLEVDEQLFMDKPKARSTFHAMQQGVLGGSSFGYDVTKARRANDGVRELHSVNLLEEGRTVYPANVETRLVGVKGADTDAEVVAEGAVAPLDAEVVQAFGDALTKAFERATETKVGRTISAKHESALGQARDLISGVLDSVAAQVAADGETDGKAEEPQVKAAPPRIAAAMAMFTDEEGTTDDG